MKAEVKIVDIPGYNLALIAKDDHYLACFRESKIIVDNAENSRLGKPIIYPELINKLHLAKLTLDYDVLSHHECVDNTNRTRYCSFTTGIEDCRFISHNMIIGTNQDAVPSGMNQMVIIELAEDGLSFTKLRRLEFEPIRTEKNWLPLYRDQTECHFLYWYNPVQIISYNFETQKTKLIHEYACPSLAHHRGELHGAASLQYGDKWLVSVRLIHAYRYVHSIWLLFDSAYNLLGQSEPFTFSNALFESCMSLSLRQDKLVACVTQGEKYNCIHTFVLQDVLDSIKLVA